MTRKELIESDEYITAFLECVVLSNKSATLMRKEIAEKWIEYRDEIISLYSATPPPASVGEWQLCPKCNGDGNLMRYNSPALSGDVCHPCDLCNGEKKIAKPVSTP